MKTICQNSKLLLKFLLALAIVSSLSGCYRMYFKNGDVPIDEERYALESEQNAWTNIVLFGLIEMSDPLNLKAKCESKTWQFAETKLSFVHGLIGYASYLLATPRSVDYQCQKPII